MYKIVATKWYINIVDDTIDHSTTAKDGKQSSFYFTVKSKG